MSSDRTSYREHLERFRERLPAEITVIALPLEDTELRAKVKDSSPELILALGPTAAKSAAKLGPDTPVVFAMVYDPEGDGLPSAPNQCGARLRVPMSDVAEALAVLRPAGKTKLRIGALHDPAAGRRELDDLEAALGTEHYQLIVAPVDSPDKFSAALAALLPKVDVLWVLMEPSLIPKDEDSLREKVLRPAMDAKVAVVGVTDWQVQKGALLAVSADYLQEGDHTARIAARVLKGDPPAKIGVEGPENVIWSLNLKVAAELGWEVPPLTRKRFERVVEP